MNLFSTLAKVLQSPPPERRDVQAALTHVAATLRELGTAGKMAVTDPAFARKLTLPVSIALDYCDALVAG
ncbi:MAG: hypothetical protein EG825_11760, partial [Rhodocyclaceae bacterium]|nr:hypothetical protein [Rhodocyclaceae bacterium]